MSMFGAKTAKPNGSDRIEPAPGYPQRQAGSVVRRLPPARPLNDGEKRLVSEVEEEIAEFVKAGGVTGGPTPLEEAIDNVDLAAPPPAAQEMANLLTSTFEAYGAALDRVRASAILETARLAHEIDQAKAEIGESKEIIANHHIDFMRRMRNHVIAVADLRRTVAAQRAGIALAAPKAAEPIEPEQGSEPDDGTEPSQL